VGLRGVFETELNMRLGPVWRADDAPQVFAEKCEVMGRFAAVVTIAYCA
jgi:hypothetical protein